MAGSGDRSINVGRDISSSTVFTGDHNTTTTTTPPPAASVDPLAEVRALKAQLLALNVPERAEMARALEDAEQEAGKPEGERDREKVGGFLERALGCVKGTNEFGAQLEELRPRIAALVGWLGESWDRLLS